VQNLGNSAYGKQVGKNWVRFKDGSRIEFEYPRCDVSGFLFGKRLIQWTETMTFYDEKNGLEGYFEFPKEAGYFGRQA
jgi:hypothetical protein